MQIEDRIRKNVVFLGVVENGEFVPKGTAFIVSISAQEFGSFLYLVTALHVVSALHQRGYKTVVVRHNSAEGFKLSSISVDDWSAHPNNHNFSTDVALVLINGKFLEDWLGADESVLLTPQLLTEWELGIGDETVIVGLFRNHAGKSRNIPVVRIGHLSALPEEPIQTRDGLIEAYLVETLSIGGLSGSPVWIHRPPTRIKDGQIQYAQGNRLVLLGLVSGHFDLPSLREDTVVDDVTGGGINSGIAVVTPAYKILETLHQPKLIEVRKAVLARLSSEAAALKN